VIRTVPPRRRSRQRLIFSLFDLAAAMLALSCVAGIVASFFHI
jgi:hypothetical protein